jgi:hypothetical protein
VSIHIFLAERLVEHKRHVHIDACSDEAVTKTLDGKLLIQIHISVSNVCGYFAGESLTVFNQRTPMGKKGRKSAEEAP